GITFSGALIASAVAAHSVSAAPMYLNTLATACAVGRNSAESTNVIIRGTLQAMAWVRLKFAASCGAALLLAGAATMVALAQHTPHPDAIPTPQSALTPVPPGDAALIVVGLLASDAPDANEPLARQIKS